MKYNLEHEKAIISAIKYDNSIYDQIELTREDFYEHKHRKIYQAIVEIIESGIRADDLTIMDYLKKNNIDIDVSYLAGIDMPTTANVTYYVESVKELSKQRFLERLGRKIKEELESGDNSEEIIEEIEQDITRIAESNGHNFYIAKEILRSTISELEEAYNAKGIYSGVRTGYEDLDKLTNGFQKGDLIIICARTSVGKTALALSMAANITIKYKIPAGFFSCEMSKNLLMKRLIAGESRIDMTKMISGMMKESDFVAVHEAAERIYPVPLFIDDTWGIKLSQLKSKARQMKRQHGVQIIFVDYLTLIRHGDPKMPRHERVGEISKSLKCLARELEIPIVVLSQVNRNAEGKVPTLANIRQSGEVEEDSDVVLILYRRKGERKTLLSVAKNRNGPVDTINLLFMPKYVRFESIDWREEKKEELIF